MPTLQTLRHVPWTCRWGQFGGPVLPAGPLTPGFVFWVCERPNGWPGPRPLRRETCEDCPYWEAAEPAGPSAVRDERGGQ